MKFKELIIDYKVSEMNFNKLEDYIIQDKKEIFLFVPDGVIEVTPTRLVKKKYKYDKPSYIIENYHNGINIYVNHNNVKYTPITRIPLEYIEKRVEKTVYKTHPGSKVSLIYELFDKELEKAYFIIDGDEDDPMIKEDICSLIDRIM